MNKKHFAIHSIIALIYLCTSCTLQSVFDQHAYERAIELKVKALALMDRAKNDQAIEHQEAIDDLKMELDILYEYESRRENNEESIKMVWIIRSSEKNLLGGFIHRWESSSGNMSAYFVEEAMSQVEEAFNLLIELESGKIKPTNEKVQSLLN